MLSEHQEYECGGRNGRGMGEGAQIIRGFEATGSVAFTLSGRF